MEEIRIDVTKQTAGLKKSHKIKNNKNIGTL